MKLLIALPILLSMALTLVILLIAIAGTVACSPFIWAWIGAQGAWRRWRGGMG